MDCRVRSSSPGLYPLGASGTLSHSRDNQKMTLPNVPGKEAYVKSSQVKATAFRENNKKNFSVVVQESSKILGLPGSYSGGFAE